MENKGLPKTIYKGHELVFARQTFTQKEADLFALMLAHMHPEDWSNNTPCYMFTAKELQNWLKIDPKNMGSKLDAICSSLSSKKIGFSITTSRGVEFEYTPIMARVSYKNAVLTMSPNSLLKEEYMRTSQGFSQITTENYFQLKNIYSKRLYEILSRAKDSKRFKLPAKGILELKGLFGLLADNSTKTKPVYNKGKSSYQNNTLFLKKCIQDSIKEISENDDIKRELKFLDGENGDLGFTAHKTGNKITSVEFHFEWLQERQLDKESAAKHVSLELLRVSKGEELTLEENLGLLDALNCLLDNNFPSDALQPYIDDCNERIAKITNPDAHEEETEDSSAFNFLMQQLT